MRDSLKALLLLNACECFDRYFWEGLKKNGLSPSLLWEDRGAVAQKLNISESADNKIGRLVSEGWAEREYQACLENNIRIVSIEDPEYPARLFKCSGAPLVLYISGQDLDLKDAVSIVGTRKCTHYGRNAGRNIAVAAASAGGTVISGGARGIDASAHEGALSAEGATVAVLGTGINVVYPKGHVDLFRRIKDNGMLISEYPLGSTGKQWRFPRRNRIIAGLSDVTVVVEAPRRSGAIITAGYAMEYGRDVWAVPGRIDEGVCSGSNALVSDGAYPLVDIPDFVNYIFSRQLEIFTQKEDNIHFEDQSGLSQLENIILALLRESGDRTVDNISSECKMSAPSVMTTLGGLCAKNLVYPSGPGRWRAGL